MDDQELEALLADLESDRVERKETLSDKKKLRQAICAFANDLPGRGVPGVLFVGARDDGSPAGIGVTDALLCELASMRDDGNIHPFPSMAVEKRRLAGSEMAVVIVEPSQAPPTRFQGRTWVRVGPRRAIATTEEERRLAERRRWADLSFDLRPVTWATVDDLDLRLFETVYLPAAFPDEVLAGNDRSMEDQLRALRLLDSEGRPTVVGSLVLGKEPARLIPGAYIQFVEFEGTEWGDDVRDQTEIAGPLPELIRRLDEVTRTHNRVPIAINGAGIEGREPHYPLRALQELSRNAVLHRNYDGTNAPVRFYWFTDRLEIHSPGGVYGNVTAENFGRPGVADYRNPHLAEAMHALGFIQRFGVGIAVARTEIASNGNPPLEFAVDPSFIVATIRRKR